MKLGLNILAVVLILLGGVWFFQAINIMLGSPMSGQPQWAIRNVSSTLRQLRTGFREYRQKWSSPERSLLAYQTEVT